jgi:hypothetical protein
MKKLLLLVLMLFGCGVVDPTPEISYSFEGFPENLDWSAIDLDGDGSFEDYVTPIKRQDCSDCYIFASVGLLEIQFHIDHNIPIDLAEQNLHNCMRISCSDTGDERNMYPYIMNFGVPPESVSPYGEWGGCQNCNSTNSNITYYSFKDWWQITNTTMSMKDRKYSMISALQHGPVAVQMTWNVTKQGNYLSCNDTTSGWHVVIVIGYINNGEYFIIKNSHGEKDHLIFDYKTGHKCHFADVATQIVPKSTYAEFGKGYKFCIDTTDQDLDRVYDIHDNCPKHHNPDQQNSDNDQYGDVCDKCPMETGENGYYCPR